MPAKQLNKFPHMFYLAASKRDGSFFNKKSLTAAPATLNFHSRSPTLCKPFSDCLIQPVYRTVISLNTRDMISLVDHLMYHVIIITRVVPNLAREFTK